MAQREPMAGREFCLNMAIRDWLPTFLANILNFCQI
jgi:hypothetical protein